MKKTASGRWVPDKPAPLPVRPRKGNASYDGYLAHLYTHRERADNCVWCDPAPPDSPPWELLNSLRLHDARRP